MRPTLIGSDAEEKAMVVEKRLGKIVSPLMMAIRLRREVDALHRIVAVDRPEIHLPD